MRSFASPPVLKNFPGFLSHCLRPSFSAQSTHPSLRIPGVPLQHVLSGTMCVTRLQVTASCSPFAPPGARLLLARGSAAVLMFIPSLPLPTRALPPLHLPLPAWVSPGPGFWEKLLWAKSLQFSLVRRSDRSMKMSGGMPGFRTHP